MTASTKVGWDQPFIPGPIKITPSEDAELWAIAQKVAAEHNNATINHLRNYLGGTGTLLQLVEYGVFIGLQTGLRLRPKMPPRDQDPYAGALPTTEPPKPEE